MAAHRTFTTDALRRLRLRHLELLAHLGEVATVRAASERLGLSQPAATKMLQEIEAVCATRLFARGRRGIEPNVAGRLLIRHATVLIRQLHATGQELEAIGQGASAKLNLGSTSTMSLLSRAIVSLRAELPRLLIRISDETPAQLVAHLLSGELDCALAPLQPEAFSSPDITKLRLEPVQADHLCVVASPDHPLAGRAGIAWDELESEPWVLSPIGALTRQRFTEIWLSRGSKPPRPAIECVSFASVRWLVRYDSSLLALMRAHQAREEAALGLIAILDVVPKVQLPDISFITRRDSAADPVCVERLLAAIRQTLEATEPASKPAQLPEPPE